MDQKIMSAGEFIGIGMDMFGHKTRGRGAWQGRFADRLGVTRGRLRQIVLAGELPRQLGIHVRDVYLIFKLTGDPDGTESAAQE